jgi:CRP-like cAMP-binding protein
MCFPLQTFYTPGDYIIRQGARGDTFFIISKGQVSSVTATELHHSSVTELVILTPLACVAGESDYKTTKHRAGEVHTHPSEGRLLRRKGPSRVSCSSFLAV